MQLYDRFWNIYILLIVLVLKVQKSFTNDFEKLVILKKTQ